MNREAVEDYTRHAAGLSLRVESQSPTPRAHHPCVSLYIPKRLDKSDSPLLTPRLSAFFTLRRWILLPPVESGVKQTIEDP